MQKNKEIIQSYLLTAARFDFSVYEQRILIRLVEMCQEQIEGKQLDKDFTINKLLFDNCRVITMPISAFLAGENDKHYSRVKEALEKLNEKRFSYEDEKIWKPIRLIEKPVIVKYNDLVQFELHSEIYETLFNFAKGYRKFELKTAMSFESNYAIRFYELMSGQKKPIAYTIEHLKMMFNVEDKYKSNPTNFIRKVVDPAQKELDKKSPYSFTYTYIKAGRKITGIKFYPVFNPANQDPEITKKQHHRQESVLWHLDKMVINYLKQYYLFTTTELKNNVELLEKANKEFDLMNLLADKRRNLDSVRKTPQAYIIGTIKSELKKPSGKYL